MSDSYTFGCELCGTPVHCGNYSDADCESCGVHYRYDEGQALTPTPEQVARWNASADLVAACKMALGEWNHLTARTIKAALAKAKP